MWSASVSITTLTQSGGNEIRRERLYMEDKEQGDTQLTNFSVAELKQVIDPSEQFRAACHDVNRGQLEVGQIADRNDGLGCQLMILAIDPTRDNYLLVWLGQLLTRQIGYSEPNFVVLDQDGWGGVDDKR